jgi:hypothetical protein
MELLVELTVKENNKRLEILEVKLVEIRKR